MKTLTIIAVIIVLLALVIGEFALEAHERHQDMDDERMCRTFRDVCDRDCKHCRWGENSNEN